MNDTKPKQSEETKESAPSVPFFARYMVTLRLKVQSGLKAGAPKALRPA